MSTRTMLPNYSLRPLICAKKIDAINSDRKLLQIKMDPVYPRLHASDSDKQRAILIGENFIAGIPCVHPANVAIERLPFGVHAVWGAQGYRLLLRAISSPLEIPASLPVVYLDGDPKEFPQIIQGLRGF